MRGAKNLGDAGGIESLVAGGSHRSSKMGTRFAVAQGEQRLRKEGTENANL